LCCLEESRRSRRDAHAGLSALMNQALELAQTPSGRRLERNCSLNALRTRGTSAAPCAPASRIISPAGPSSIAKSTASTKIAADTDLGVEALEADALEAGAVQQVADHVRPGHREGTRATVHLCAVFGRDHRDERAHAALGVVEPGVGLALAPYDHHKLAARRERAADVAHGGARAFEEHGAEAGERAIVAGSELVDLRIGGDEARVCDPRGARLGPGRGDEVGGAVDADRFAAGPDLLGDAERALAEAAADVQHARPVGMRVPRQRLVAVRERPLGQAPRRLPAPAPGTPHREIHGRQTPRSIAINPPRDPEKLPSVVGALREHERGLGRSVRRRDEAESIKCAHRVMVTTQIGPTCSPRSRHRDHRDRHRDRPDRGIVTTAIGIVIA
jgi:hypothetical protein